MYVKVTNYVNWHKAHLWLDRENTGNLKIQFEWVPLSSPPPPPALGVLGKVHLTNEGHPLTLMEGDLLVKVDRETTQVFAFDYQGP